MVTPLKFSWEASVNEMIYFVVYMCVCVCIYKCVYIYAFIALNK